MALVTVRRGGEARAVAFFFSSRRRHTRCSRDWSSDCALPISRCGFVSIIGAPNAGKSTLTNALVGTRSEERRVGKECRSRRAPDQKKKTEGGHHRVSEAEIDRLIALHQPDETKRKSTREPRCA